MQKGNAEWGDSPLPLYLLTPPPTIQDVVHPYHRRPCSQCRGRPALEDEDGRGQRARIQISHLILCLVAIVCICMFCHFIF